MLLAVISGVSAAGASGGTLQRGDVLVSTDEPDSEGHQHAQTAIQVYSPEGAFLFSFAHGAGANQLCVSPDGKYVVAPGAGLFDSAGNELPSHWGSVRLEGSCAVDGYGQVYVAGGPAPYLKDIPPAGVIWKYDIKGGTLETYTVPVHYSYSWDHPVEPQFTWLAGLFSLALGPDQCTVYYDGSEDSYLQRFDACREIQRPSAKGLESAQEIQVRANGQILDGTPGRANLFDPIGETPLHVLRSWEPSETRGHFSLIGLASDGTSVWIGSPGLPYHWAPIEGCSAAYHFDLETGVLLGGLSAPCGGTTATRGLAVDGAPGPQPVVEGISPNAGLSEGGTSVAITGSGFVGVSAVKFGPTSPAASFTVNSPTSITAVAPEQPAGSTDVTVTAGGATSELSSSDVFTVERTPGLAPKVQTGPDVNFGGSRQPYRAELSGKVNPRGEDVTSCEVEWGLTEAYGGHADCSALPGAGEVPVLVSGLATGLPGSTIYHYRFVAMGAGGTAYGEDRTFQTPPAPPDVLVSPTTGISQDTAILHGTVNPHEGALTRCAFLVAGQSVACSVDARANTPVEVSATVRGLKPGTLYPVLLDAENRGGNTVSLEGGSFETLPAAAPEALVSVTTGIGQDTAVVHGTVDPREGTVTRCEFLINARSVPCPVGPRWDRTTPIAVSATVSGLKPGTSYVVLLDAENSGGNTLSLEAGSYDNFETLPAAAPDALVSPTTGIGQDSAVLRGTVNPNGGTVTRCEFLIDGRTVPCSSNPGRGGTAVAVSANVAALKPGTPHLVLLDAENAGGNALSLEAGSYDNFETGLPSLPEFGRCENTIATTSRYGNSNCTRISARHGVYEWVPWRASEALRFSVDGGIARLQSAGGTKITCSASRLEGESTGSKTVSATLVLGGCLMPRQGGTCRTSGASPGEIASPPLQGELGYILRSAKPKIGLAFRPRTGAALLSFACPHGAASVTGSVIATIGPVDSMSSQGHCCHTFRFRASGVRQRPESFEGASPNTLVLRTTAGEERVSLTLAKAAATSSGLDIETKAVG